VIVLYRTQFERLNFGYNPPLRQTADVVFETDIPFDDEHLEEFESAAWAAVWKQNPHWQDPTGPIDGRPGWSSVLGGSKYTKIS
jgi:hypothetical protein